MVDPKVFLNRWLARWSQFSPPAQTVLSLSIFVFNSVLLLLAYQGAITILGHYLRLSELVRPVIHEGVDLVRVASLLVYLNMVLAWALTYPFYWLGMGYGLEFERYPLPPALCWSRAERRNVLGWRMFWLFSLAAFLNLGLQLYRTGFAG